MEELVQLVAQQADISLDQAELAISAMMSYLTARLPSPVVGRIREQLSDAQPSCNSDFDQSDVK